MFVTYTYQDWLEAGEDKRDMIIRVIQAYRQSDEFKKAMEATEYFRSDNREIRGKTIMKAHTATTTDERGVTKKTSRVVSELSGSRIANGFFFRFVTQENQHLLSNGVVLADEELKARLGMGFDKALERMGEKALVQGVCWGYWNMDHLEVLPAMVDVSSGTVVLLDEMTSAPMVGLQFWRLTSKKPLWVRVFEPDGVTVWQEGKNKQLVVAQEKRPYQQIVVRDAAGEMIVGGSNYGALPLVPLYANEEHASELTPSIKAKIDAYDRILSDFDNNLDRANDVYWVLNNFGGNINQIMETMDWINKLKMVVNKVGDMGTGGASAEPRTVDVPHEARSVALELLKKALYQDYMALDMDEVTGGSLTNVAIQAATANLNMKVNRFEWQVFAFVQQVLRLIGVETEEIRFNRQTIGNESETIDNIYKMREDIDRATALKLNPYINQEDIQQIMDKLDEEEITGISSVDELNKAVNEDEPADGSGDER